jgi:hypothetical protein
MYVLNMGQGPGIALTEKWHNGEKMVKLNNNNFLAFENEMKLNFF